MAAVMFVRVLPIACLLGCGRVGFDAPPAGDARLADVAAGASYRDVILASAPRMYYRLDETGGMVAADSSGHGLDARYDAEQNGTLTFAQASALSRDPDAAVAVSGDGNYGPNVIASVVFDPTNMSWAGDFTVEVFVMPHALPPVGASAAIFVCEAYMMNGLRVGWDHQMSLETWTTEAGGTSSLDTSTPLVLERFQHIVAVHAGTSIALYIDGVLAVTDPAFDYIPVDTTTAECGIGAFHGMPSYATFDELAIYDRALSAAEIAVHVAHR